jgi:hypothetical protein
MATSPNSPDHWEPLRLSRRCVWLFIMLLLAVRGQLYHWGSQQPTGRPRGGAVFSPWRRSWRGELLRAHGVLGSTGCDTEVDLVPFLAIGAGYEKSRSARLVLGPWCFVPPRSCCPSADLLRPTHCRLAAAPPCVAKSLLNDIAVLGSPIIRWLCLGDWHRSRPMPRLGAPFTRRIT